MEKGDADLVVFFRLPLNVYDRGTFHSGEEHGYTKRYPWPDRRVR